MTAYQSKAFFIPHLLIDGNIESQQQKLTCLEKLPELVEEVILNPRLLTLCLGLFLLVWHQVQHNFFKGL